jgi:lauroyl/myristoyl acyltransferase
MFLLKNSKFSKNLDLLPWVQKNLLPSKIEESTCEREGELTIKFEKERMRATERNLEN